MRRQGGQTTAEYAIVLGVVVAAIVAMQLYVKRGAQAQLKTGVDEFIQAGTGNTWLGVPDTSGGVKMRSTKSQYEPYYAESDYTVDRSGTTTEAIDLPGGTITRTIAEGKTADTTTRKAGGKQTQRGTSGAD